MLTKLLLLLLTGNAYQTRHCEVSIGNYSHLRTAIAFYVDSKHWWIHTRSNREVLPSKKFPTMSHTSTGAFGYSRNNR